MAARSATTNLPAETTSFVGREEEVERLTALFRAGERLVTLVGPAGTGKTRLSRRVAADAVARGALASACFCDLSEARSREDVVATVAAALEVAPLGDDVADTIAHALLGRGALLVVLDNFEQITAWAHDTVALWLDQAPEVRFLVTSRERLLLAAERCFEVPPLPVGVAVTLFVDRARAVRADFVRTEANAPDLEALVLRLDGMPLAIELAAARVDVLPPKKLLERISTRLDLLKNRQQHLVARQATLRNALDWSWDLLDEPERESLAACSVFRGGFSLEAAEAVIPAAQARSSLDLVQALVEKSLVRRYEPPGIPGEARFGLYESIRDYAAEKLAERKHAALYEGQHAAYFAAEGEVWEEKLRRGQTGGSIARHRLESDNLLAAFERTRDRDMVTATRAGVSAAAALAGSVSAEQLLELLDRVVVTAERAAERDAGARPLLAKAVLERAQARHTSGMSDLARADIERAITLARDAKNDTLHARALIALGIHQVELGRPDDGKTSIEQGLAIARAAGDTPLEGDALRQLGNMFLKHNQLDESRTCFLAALSIFRSIGHDRLACSVLCGLGIIAQWQGREAEAEADFLRALDLALELGERREEGVVRTNLGLLYTDQARIEDAERELMAALALQRRSGHRQFVGNTIGCLAALAHLTGQLSEARRRYAESLSIFRELKKRRYEATGLRYGGVLALEEGRNADALVDLTLAAEIADEVGDLQALTYGPLGAALAASDRVEAAERAFGVAQASLVDRGEPRAVALLALWEGFLDLARARAAGAGDARDAHRRRATARIDAARGARQGADARVALRVLEKAVALEGAPPPPKTTDDARPVLRLGADARWFELDGGARVDLSKRKALRLILKRLADAWEGSPRAGVDAGELIASGWPGEKIQTEAASARLYTAIKTLREAGLAGALLRQDDGYLLSPEWRLERHS